MAAFFSLPARRRLVADSRRPMDAANSIFCFVWFCFARVFCRPGVRRRGLGFSPGAPGSGRRRRAHTPLGWESASLGLGGRPRKAGAAPRPGGGAARPGPGGPARRGERMVALARRRATAGMAEGCAPAARVLLVALLVLGFFAAAPAPAQGQSSSSSSSGVAASVTSLVPSIYSGYIRSGDGTRASRWGFLFWRRVRAGPAFFPSR